jgi:hypothetical protein
MKHYIKAGPELHDVIWDFKAMAAHVGHKTKPVKLVDVDGTICYRNSGKEIFTVPCPDYVQKAYQEYIDAILLGHST